MYRGERACIVYIEGECIRVYIEERGFIACIEGRGCIEGKGFIEGRVC